MDPVQNETKPAKTGLQRYRENVTEKKQTDILEAATKLFRALGFQKTGMAEVAHVADVSTATLYKHFRSKEELLSEVIKQERDREKGAGVDYLCAMAWAELHEIGRGCNGIEADLEAARQRIVTHVIEVAQPHPSRDFKKVNV